jgi:hypothetical protein
MSDHLRGRRPISVEVWIASHLDCSQRSEFLHSLLKTLLSYQLDLVRVSISGTPPLVNFPEEDKIEYYYHPNQKLQFEHYKYISTHAQHISQKTKIILLDDDDVLLPNFFELVSVSDQGLAMQVVAFSNFDEVTFDYINEQFTQEDFSSLTSSETSSLHPVSKNGKMMLRVDHSGSWCLPSNIDHFFRKTEEIGYMTDYSFRAYLTNKCEAKVSLRPIVMARKWTPVSFWAREFAESERVTKV